MPCYYEYQESTWMPDTPTAVHNSEPSLRPRVWRQASARVWKKVTCSIRNSIRKVSISLTCGSDGKEFACNAEDPGSIPGSGTFPWRKEWLPTPVFFFFSFIFISWRLINSQHFSGFQYSCPGNAMDRKAWQITLHGSHRVGHDSSINTSSMI